MENLELQEQLVRENLNLPLHEIKKKLRKLNPKMTNEEVEDFVCFVIERNRKEKNNEFKDKLKIDKQPSIAEELESKKEIDRYKEKMIQREKNKKKTEVKIGEKTQRLINIILEK